MRMPDIHARSILRPRIGSASRSSRYREIESSDRKRRGPVWPHACSSRHCPLYSRFVATITEVEKLALDLPAGQRAILAAHLLGSLPSVLHDEDDGIAEALKRDADLDANPASGVSLGQLDEQVRRRRN